MRIIGSIVIFFYNIILPSTLDGAGWWRLYFTSPGNADSRPGVENPGAGLVSIIKAAKKYFYGAFYEISDPRIVKALIYARKRGVSVSLVTETDRARRRRNIQDRMSAAGIGIVSDNRRGLMHNKFAVIDGQYVWTGSYNPTLNDVEKNNNNAILIRSAQLAQIYQNEFTQMCRGQIFGSRRKAGPFADAGNRYYVKIEDTNINVYFSPDDNVERIILKRLSKAESSIHFMAYSFTSDRIGEMMITKFKQGVPVYGMFERRGTGEAHSEYVKMKLEGLP